MRFHPPLSRWIATPHLDPAPPAWRAAEIDVPEELRTTPGLPPHSGERPPAPRDFRLFNRRQVAWSRAVQPRPADGIGERIVRTLVDLRLTQLRRVSQRIARRRPCARSAPADPGKLTATLRAAGQRADGCAVCIKTCPVQRHGLEHVLEVYREAGEIVDRGGEFESYRCPRDDRVYRTGERPRLAPGVRRPPALSDLAQGLSQS